MLSMVEEEGREIFQIVQRCVRKSHVHIDLAGLWAQAQLWGRRGRFQEDRPPLPPAHGGKA